MRKAKGFCAGVRNFMGWSPGGPREARRPAQLRALRFEACEQRRLLSATLTWNGAAGKVWDADDLPNTVWLNQYSQQVPWSNGDIAKLSATGGGIATNVKVSDSSPGSDLVWASAIEFGAANYSISGNTANDVLAVPTSGDQIASTQVTVGAGATGTITAKIAPLDGNGGSELDATGGGTLVIDGSGSSTAGTIVVGASSGDRSTLKVSGHLTVTSATGLEVLNDAALSGSGTISVGANSQLYYGSWADSTFDGKIDGAGCLAVGGVEGGSLTLTNSSTYLGWTYLTSGTLQLGSVDNCLPQSTVVDFDNGRQGDATLDLGGTNQAIAGLEVTTGGGDNSLVTTASSHDIVTDTGSDPSTLTVGVSNNGQCTFAGTIEDGYYGGTVELKLDAGGLVLAGHNTFSGGTHVDGGTLTADTDEALGSEMGGLWVDGSGVLDLNGCSPDVATLMGTGNGEITDGSSDASELLVGYAFASEDITGSYSGTIDDGAAGSGGVSLILEEEGTLTLTGNNSYTGQTIFFDSANLVIAGGDANSNREFDSNVASRSDNSTLTVDPAGTLDFKGTIGGALDVVKEGDGTLILDNPSSPGNANSYSDGTEVDGGTLKLANSGSLPTGYPVTISDGSQLDLNGQSATVSRLTLNDGSVVDTAGGGSLSAGSEFELDNAAVSANLTGTAKLEVNPGGGPGTNTVVLSGDDTFTGIVGVHAGTLEVDGSIAPSSLAVSGAAQLSGSGTITDQAGNLYYDSSAASTFDGTIGGSYGLELGADTGSLTLTAANAYTGGTLLDDSAGTLIFDEGDALPQGATAADGTPAGTALEIDAGGAVLNSALMDASGLGFASGDTQDTLASGGRRSVRSGLDDLGSGSPQGDTLTITMTADPSASTATGVEYTYDDNGNVTGAAVGADASGYITLDVCVSDNNPTSDGLVNTLSALVGGFYQTQSAGGASVFDSGTGLGAFGHGRVSSLWQFAPCASRGVTQSNGDIYGTSNSVTSGWWAAFAQLDTCSTPEVDDGWQIAAAAPGTI
ncbi:MAG: autotransporter-associated beta strand repeat-containing protein, partial [Thermoguttaceae bacterium]